MTNEPTSSCDALEELADSFVARFRNGERPSIEEYAQRYPEHADQLRELLPALVLLETATPNDTAAFGGSKPTASLPAEIGEFTIVREIGRGGMGVVYEAIQQSLGRHVALKVLSSVAILHPTHLERFKLEARAAARLHHTHIVPVFGVGEHNGLHYYAMQFIQGQSLDLVIDALRQMRLHRDNLTMAPGNAATLAMAQSMLSGQFRADSEASWDADKTICDKPQQDATIVHSKTGMSSSALALESAGGFTSSEFTTSHGGREFYRSVARVGLQVAEALTYAHTEGILHRDIKPSNLLLDAKGNVWVTDFGLARDESTDGLTRTGDFVGTLRYMPPERLEGWSDRRSDVYSLGATLYELLTQRPFLESGSRGQLVEKILHVNPPPPSKSDPAIPRDLETIVLKAIEKEPSARYRTADALAEDLQLFLADRSILARRSTPREQFVRWCRRSPLVASLTGVVAALLVASLVILAVSNARIRRESQAKDAALATARQAVDQMLIRVADQTLSDVPLSHPLRQALLEDALGFYEGFLAQADSNPALREATSDPEIHAGIADVLVSVSGIQLDLGRYAEARESMVRGVRLWEDLVATSPDSFEYREGLANAEKNLAYALNLDPAFVDKNRVAAHYRRAVEIYTELEADFPDRRQDYVQCLAHLAGLARDKSDRAAAIDLWRRAIDNGEGCLEQDPGDSAARIQVCWACAALGEQLIIAPETAQEAEHILQQGLHHAELLLQQSPRAPQVRHVAAFLKIPLGELAAKRNLNQKSAELFAAATQEMQALTEANPSSKQLWYVTRWAQRLWISTLLDAKDNAAAQSALLKICDWIQRVTPHVPEDPEPQSELLECRSFVFTTRTSMDPGFDPDGFDKVIRVLSSSSPDGDKLGLGFLVWQAIATLRNDQRSEQQTENGRALVREIATELQRSANDPNSGYAARVVVANACVELGGLLIPDPNCYAESDLLEEPLAEFLKSLLVNCPNPSTDREHVGHMLRTWAYAWPWPGKQSAHAEAGFREALDVFQDLTVDYPDSHSALHFLADTNRCLGDIYAGQARRDDAEQAYRRAVELFEQYHKKFPDASVNESERAASYLSLANFLSQTGSNDEVQRLYSLGSRALERALTTEPAQVQSYYLVGLSRARANDREGYREVCKIMLKSFSALTDESERDRLAWTFVLAPDATPDFSEPLRISEVAVAKNPGNAGYLATLGALYFRSHQFEKAGTRLRESILAFESDQAHLSSKNYPLYFLAMNQWRQGNKDEARQLLTTANRGMEEELSEFPAWNRQATLELLRQEAEALIQAETTLSEAPNSIEQSPTGSAAEVR